ncbi:MAG TPA: VCBS repeat-containing protein, partial [Thermoanaerobaculia bacterium]
MKPFLLAFLAAVQVSSAAAAPLFRNPQPVRLPSDATTFLLGGDFNSDGHLDALVVGGGQYSVLLANGTGPFAAPLTGSLFPTPCCGEPAAGDMNGDGKLDLVLVLMGAIHVLAGNGDGTFTAGSATATTSNVGSTTLADFNGDDLLDLAIGAHSIGDTTLTVHFGDGEGNFSGAETTDIGAQTYALTPAYINGDAVVDLVAGWPASRVLIGDGDGTFTLGASFPDGTALVADFNHDGDADLAVTTGTFDNDSIEVSLGNGDGTFGTPAEYATARQPGRGTVADVDDDGNPDILMTGTSGSVVAVHRGNADGTFDAVAYYLSGPNPNQILAADFDRDGDVDFVTADQDTNIPALSFVRGNGDATFDAYRAFHWPDLAASRMVVADVNHDDAPDVLALQSDDLAVLLNDGTGKLEAPIVSETEVDSQYFATGDVNNDGHLDAVIVNEDHSAGAKTLLGNGDGTFDAPIANATLDGAGPATLAHFNGDTYLDVFMAGGAAYAEVYAGNGDGTFAGATYTSMDARDAIFGDLNGDDITDFVRWKTGAITIALNDGTGQFTSADIATGGEAILALADFNGDGALDLLSRTTSGTETRFGNGD